MEWEWSSNLVLLAVVAAVLAFERRYCLQWDTWRANLRWHVLASVVFSLLHVLAMVGLRKLAYAPARVMNMELATGRWNCSTNI